MAIRFAVHLHQQFVLSGFKIVTSSRRGVLGVDRPPHTVGKDPQHLSCAYLSSVRLIWWCACSDLLLVFKLGCLLSFRSSLCVLDMLKISAWYQVWDLEVFSLMLWLFILSSVFQIVEVLNFFQSTTFKKQLFLAALGLCCGKQGLLFIVERASPRGGFSWCRTQAPGHVVLSSCSSRALEPALSGGGGTWLSCSMAPGSSRTRDQTLVPCIGRQTPDHWTTREVRLSFSSMDHAFGIISKNASPKPTSQFFSDVFCFYRS